MDAWTSRDKLALISMMQSRGVTNDWAAVSKLMRQYAETSQRPMENFTAKNCALHYQALLDDHSQNPKGSNVRRRSVNAIEPAQLISLLTMQCINELTQQLQQQQAEIRKCKREIDQVTAGKVPPEQVKRMLEMTIAEDRAAGIPDDDQDLETWRKRLRMSGWKATPHELETMARPSTSTLVLPKTPEPAPIDAKPIATNELEEIMMEGETGEDDDKPLAQLKSKTQEKEAEEEPKAVRTSPRKRSEPKSAPADSLHRESPIANVALTPDKPGRRGSVASSVGVSPRSSRAASPVVATKSAAEPETKVPGDFETMADYKHWKTQILAVWKMIAAHKHANVFSQPVSESIAPGYKRVVKYPMDLASLKKLVDSGQVTSTAEFKRQLLQMFVNAAMYNSTGHDIYNIAKEMAKDTRQILQEMLGSGSQLKTVADIAKSRRSIETHTRRSLRASGSLRD